jgi:hypothetical protein
MKPRKPDPLMDYYGMQLESDSYSAMVHRIAWMSVGYIGPIKKLVD